MELIVQGRTGQGGAGVGWGWDRAGVGWGWGRAIADVGMQTHLLDGKGWGTDVTDSLRMGDIR